MAGPRKVQSKPVLVEAYRLPTPDEIFLAGEHWENLINEASNWIKAHGATVEGFDTVNQQLYFITPLTVMNVGLGSWVTKLPGGTWQTHLDDTFWSIYRDLPSATHNPTPLPVPPKIPEPEFVVANDGFVNPLADWYTGAPRYFNDIDRVFEAMQIPLPNKDIAEKDMEESHRAIAQWIDKLGGEADFDRKGHFKILMPNTDFLEVDAGYWILRDQSSHIFTRSDRVFRDEYTKEKEVG